MRRVLVLVSLATLMWLSGCGGSGSSSGSGGNPGGGGGGSGANLQAISVNTGPLNNYANGVFTSVTVCVPGTANCQTIPEVLVDTGSSGLRILSSVLTLPLTSETTAGGTIVECAQFSDGFTWGPLKMADVKLAGKVASNIPIQVIDANAFAVPTACSNTGKNESTLNALLTNGILGVGLFLQDCGGGCVTPGAKFYFTCASSSNCVETGALLAQQVQNPVAKFSGDNNGVLIELPALSGSGSNLSGSLIFGIGTQSNNALGSATVLPVAANGTITTVFAKNNTSYPGSFIDSGSNGFFFLDTATTGIPTCSGSASAFYCPTTLANVSATNKGTNGAGSAVMFSVANAQTLFNSSNNAFSQLGGPNPNIFDFGLPFFFGRKVFTAIEGQNTPGGPGPYVAY